MKKITTLLLCIWLCAVLLCAASAADAPTVSVVCDPACSGGDTVTAAIRLGGMTDYAAVSLRLQYDNTKLSVLSVARGSAFSDGLVTTNTAYSENEVFLSYTGTAAISTEGDLFTVTFAAANTASGDAAFAINGLKVMDVNSAPMEVTAETASVSITYDPVILMPVLSAESIADGETVTVDVSVRKLSDYCAVSFRVEYDPKLFTVASVTKGNAFSGELFTVNTAYSENEVYISYICAEPVSVNDVLAEITFTAKEYVSGTADFTVTNIRAKDVDSAFIEVAAGAASLGITCRHADITWETVTEASCGVAGKKEFVCLCGYTDSEEIPARTHNYVGTLYPPTETEAGYTEYVCGYCGDTYTDDSPILGDMDGDFRITIADALRALKQLLNGDHTDYPDMNADGAFSLLDIIRLLKKATEV